MEKMKVGGIVVKKPTCLFNVYGVYEIRNQTPKMIVLDELHVRCNIEYPSIGNARFIITYEPTKSKINSTQKKKTALLSDYVPFDKDKIY